MSDIMHTLTFWVGYKGHTLNCEDKYNLIELSDLIGFGYDLMDFSVEEWELYFVVNILFS